MAQIRGTVSRNVTTDDYNFEFVLSTDHVVVPHSGPIHNMCDFLGEVSRKYLPTIEDHGFYIIRFDQLTTGEDLDRYLAYPVKSANKLKWKVNEDGVYVQVASTEKVQVDGTYAEYFKTDVPYEPWTKEKIVQFFRDLAKATRLYKVDEPTPFMLQDGGHFDLGECKDALHFLKKHSKVKISGVNTPWGYVSTPLTAGVEHTEDGGVGSLNVMVVGWGKLWLIMNYENTLKLRKIVGDKYGNGCLGTLNNRVYLFPPWVLEEWGIEFKFFEQKVNEMIVTTGGAGHQIYNGGYCVNDTINIVIDVTDSMAILCPKDSNCFCHTKSEKAMKEYEKRGVSDPDFALEHGTDVLRDFDYSQMVRMAKKFAAKEKLRKAVVSLSTRAADADEAPQKKVYTCTVCDKTYSDRWSRRTHIESVHQKKRFHCTYPDCSVSLSSRASLCRHKKYKH